MESWESMLKEAFKETGDNYEKMETTLTDEEIKQKFDDGYGGSEGDHFTTWGDVYVYFPIVYDGAESIGYAPRNPCDIKTSHWGGE